VTDVPMMRLGDTETDLLLASDGQDVFVVLKRGEIMKCVVRFVENGRRFIRCEKIGRNVFDVRTDGNNGLYWTRSEKCMSLNALVVKKLGASSQYIGAAPSSEGIDIFFCTKTGKMKEPIMCVGRYGMAMYTHDGIRRKCGMFVFDGLSGTAPYYYGPFEEREACL
jgi:hypothetical protein